MQKVIAVLFIAFAFIANLSAQIETEWTTSLPNRLTPTGFVAPTVTVTIPDDYQQVSFDVFLLDTMSTEYGDTTLLAIGDHLKAYLDSNYVVQIWGLDESLNIEGVYTITDVLHRFEEFDPKVYKEQYQTATPVYRVRGRFRWGINTP